MTPPKESLMESAGTTMVNDALDAELARVLDAYVAAVESGHAVDPDRLLIEHPAIADRLQGCLASLRFLGDATISLGGAPALDPSGAAIAAGPTLGDYRIIRELGRGGMGIVYEAEQVSLGRRVAIKVLPFAAVLDQKQIQRFKNEAHAAAQLHHTSIVPVFAVGCERGVHFYAMQFIDGQSLSQVIKDLRAIAGLPGEADGDSLGSVSELSKGLAAGWFEPAQRAAATRELATPGAPDTAAPRARLREDSGATALGTGTPGASTRSRAFFRSAASLGLQAAEALEHAHSLGIVHRDVKPGNFLLDVRGDLWVTDFGLARCQSDASLTMSGDLLGTLRYMSPEQALAKRVTVDHRTDIYSLGATLYELLTLEPVFDGRDRQELLRKIAFEEPRSPRRLNRSIPLDLETIVLKAVTKDPGGRYASAREMADDLKSFLDDRPIQARRLTLLQKAARWSRRRKVGVSAAAAILVLFGATGILGYRSYREAQWSAYREKVERAAAAIGLAQTSVNALNEESSRMLEFNEHSVRMLRMQGLEGMLQPLREAAGDLEGAREIFPGRPDASYYLARALLLLERRDEAVKELERALAADRDFAPAIALLAALEESRAIDGPANGKKDRARVEKVLSGDWARTLLAIHRAVARKEWKEAAEGYGKLIDLEERGTELYLASGIESRLGRGVALLGAKDYVGALMDFAGAKARWPASLVPDLLVGNALLLLGEEEKAEKVFNAAYDRAAFKNEVAYGVMCYYAGNSMDRRRERIEKAIAWADRLDRKDLGEQRKAELYAWMGNAEKAVEAAEKALGLNLSDARSHSILGMVLRFTERSEEAERHVLEAVRLDTSSAESCWALGWFYADRGLLLEAAAAGREAHRRNPKDLHNYVLVGRWLSEAGQFKEARLVLQDILAKDPNSTWALEHLGQVLTFEGKPEEALQVYDKALKINPECPATSNSRAWTLRQMGRLEQAEDQARKAIEFGPMNQGAPLQLALTFLEAKEYQQAIDVCRIALRDYALFAPFHSCLGQALEAQGEVKEALWAYVKAVELNLSRTEYTPYNRAAALLETRPELSFEAPALAEVIGKVFDAKDLHPGLTKLVMALAPRLEGPERAVLRGKLMARARREAERSQKSRTGILFSSEGIFTRELHQPEDPNASTPEVGDDLDVTIRASLGPGGPIPLVKEVVHGTFGPAQLNVQDGGVVTAIAQDPVHPVGMFADARAILVSPICAKGNGEVIHDEGGTPGEPSDDSYTISSVGHDIWVDGDSFTFAHTKVAGDFVFTAHIAGRSKAPARWGKHGVMARQDVTPWSRYSFLEDQQPVNNSGGDLDQTRWTSRPTHGGDDNFETIVLGPSEHHDWVRIERAGNVFKGYSSADGPDGTWIQHGSEDWGPSAPTAVLVGLAVTSHTTDCGLPLTIQFDHVDLVLKPGASLVPLEGPDPAGIEVTWRDVPREKLKEGLHYTLADVDPGTVRFGFGGTGVTDIDPRTRWRSPALFRALGLQEADSPGRLPGESR